MGGIIVALTGDRRSGGVSEIERSIMSENKHTPGKANAQSWMGTESDPRWTVTIGGAIRFITAGDNDESNAIEAKRRWNSHEPGGSHDVLVATIRNALTTTAIIAMPVQEGTLDIATNNDLLKVMAASFKAVLALAGEGE